MLLPETIDSPPDLAILLSTISFIDFLFLMTQTSKSGFPILLKSLASKKLNELSCFRIHRYCALQFRDSTKKKTTRSKMGFFHLFHCCRHAALYFIIYIAFVCPLGSMAVGPYFALRPTSTLVLLPKQSVPIEKKDGRNTISISLSPKQKEYYRSFRQTMNELITGHVRKPSHRYFQHALYWLTAVDTVISVFLNEYTDFSFPGAPALIPIEKQGMVREVYSKLFYFARMRPRLLYSIGALVRALSLCTPLRHLLDPTVGVGAGIHFFAYLTGSRVSLTYRQLNFRRHGSFSYQYGF